MKTWKIAYTVQDGEYEYGDDFTCELDAAELDGNTVAAVIADHWDIDRKRGFDRTLQAVTACG